MKNLKLGISALALTVAMTVSGQTTSNPWLIGVGAHGVNHLGGQFSSFKDLNSLQFRRTFNIDNHTIIPPLSKLTVARNLNKSFVLDWQTSVGNIDQKRFKMEKEFFLMTGLGLQFKINSFWNEESWFDPYLRVGASYLRHDLKKISFPIDDIHGTHYNAYSSNGELNGKKDHFVVLGGIGSNFWITNNFGLGLQYDIVSTPISIDPQKGQSGATNFSQASASILFKFGNRDKDKDGIPDKKDRCPDIPGLPQFEGCPDTDGDGIPDIDDHCPTVAGPAENHGCPWPDTDDDGVLDKDDHCPTIAGPAENHGCPWPDTDGDGIPDKDDHCPTIPGLPESQGCPKPQTVYAKEATGALQGILFEFDKATIKQESHSKLNQAAEIIKSSNGTFLVEGHTDAKGSAKYNLNLSRRRAAAVVQALEDRGVNPNQLKSKGKGSEEAKIPASAPSSEREKDRKVVVKAIDAAAWDAMDKSDLPVVRKKVVKRKSSVKARGRR